MTKLESLSRQYFELLNSQEFDSDALDYQVLENYQPLLHQLSQMKNSGVTVFDMHQRKHIYVSRNFEELFGYDVDRAIIEDSAYFDSKVHPEDNLVLMELGINMLNYFFEVPPHSRADFKAINEYRVLNREGEYIRVIEQHQPLEMDSRGNLWLTLSTLDISPRQDQSTGVKSTVINFKTGSFVPIPSSPKHLKEAENLPELTQRETEILQLVKKGHPSKTISDLLFISVHTVNTHRQRILQKLAVNSSIEALEIAERLGLI